MENPEAMHRLQMRSLEEPGGSYVQEYPDVKTWQNVLVRFMLMDLILPCTLMGYSQSGKLSTRRSVCQNGTHCHLKGIEIRRKLQFN